MHEIAQNPRKIFDYLDYYQKCIKNSSKSKNFS